MAKKMTKRELFEALLKLNEVKSNQAYVDGLTHEIEILDNRKNSDKPTKTQEANKLIKATILEGMANGTKYTIAEISKFNDIPEDSRSSQKISALVTQLKNDNLVIREEIKGKAYFSKVEG